MGVSIGGGFGPLRVSVPIRFPRGGSRSLSPGAQKFWALMLAIGVVVEYLAAVLIGVGVALIVAVVVVWPLVRWVRKKERIQALTEQLLGLRQAIPAGTKALDRGAVALKDGKHDRRIPRGHRLLGHFTGVDLVELRSERRAGPRSFQSVRAGSVFVTDRGVRFVDCSGSRRDWLWERTTSVSERDRALVIAVENRQEPSGLRADDVVTAMSMAVLIGLSAAADSGDVEEFRAQVEGELAAMRLEEQEVAAELARLRKTDPPAARFETEPKPTAGAQAAEAPTMLVESAPPAALAPAAEHTAATRPLDDLDAAALSALVSDIVTVEGPMTFERLVRRVAVATGTARMTGRHRTRVTKACRAAELVTDQRSGEPVVRTAEQPAVVVRELGGRTLHEVPLDEIAVHAAAAPEGDPEKVPRHVLRVYGLNRLTAAARTRIEQAAALNVRS